ncbi:unnamed protein product [Trifolium pratense]|uniref:Uncharacterized protein n=1 Tax=Trifolium pratense TaxID=57577 RepID=A0ACB0L108_TRIPR|nr:unnamed protein product [Trifolium pratense]
MRLWQNTVETCAQILDRAFHLIEDWKHANNNNKHMQQTIATVTASTTTNDELATNNNNRVDRVGTVWKKPTIGRYKCNIDASFSTQQNRVGLGMCIRDDEGRFVLAKTMWISPICSVDLGKALGLFHAINWVHDLQLQRVDFALDSKTVVDYFHKGGPNITEFGDVLNECIRRFKSYFENSRVEFNRRQANEVAHALARVAPSIARSHVFIDVPTCISHLIMNEML